MTHSNKYDFTDFMGVLALCTLFIVSTSVIFYNLGFESAVETMQQAAIEHGAAEYDTTTGIWRWKEGKNAAALEVRPKQSDPALD